MTAFDYAVIAVVVLSVGMGWWRGLVYEAVTLLSWVVAYMLSRGLAADVAIYLPAALDGEVTRTAVAFALLFVVVLMLGSILAWALSKVVQSTELASLDGSLGALFGLLRGVVLVLVLVLLAGMTELPRTTAWRDALSSGTLETVAVEARTLLPDGLAQKIHYRN